MEMETDTNSHEKELQRTLWIDQLRMETGMETEAETGSGTDWDRDRDGHSYTRGNLREPCRLIIQGTK